MIDDDDAIIRDANQRICNRLRVNRTLLLEFENGDILRGRTIDISPRGVLMETETQVGDEMLGIDGMLYVISGEGHFSVGYPCKIVRVRNDSVALEIHKKAAAAFGAYMTEDLLGNLKR